MTRRFDTIRFSSYELQRPDSLIDSGNEKLGGDMRRLRSIADSVREQLAGAALPETIGVTNHTLIEDIRDIQILHRPIVTAAKRRKSIPWFAYSFRANEDLISPFQVYPGRYWAFQQVHKQPSGLPELVTHISKEFPSASECLEPHFYVGFSHSPNIETTVDTVGLDPLHLQFFHSGSLRLADGIVLPGDYCLPRMRHALPTALVDEDVPGINGVGDARALYLGSLVFYNHGRTADKARLRRFLLNNTATALVSRYVRDAVCKHERSKAAPVPSLEPIAL
jgi:hypothetical protein